MHVFLVLLWINWRNSLKIRSSRACWQFTRKWAGAQNFCEKSWGSEVKDDLSFNRETCLSLRFWFFDDPHNMNVLLQVKKSFPKSSLQHVAAVNPYQPNQPKKAGQSSVKPQNRHIFNPRRLPCCDVNHGWAAGHYVACSEVCRCCRAQCCCCLLLPVVWVIWKDETPELINMYWSVYSTVPSLQVRGLRWNLKETSANRVHFQEIYLIACQFMTWDLVRARVHEFLELPLDSIR